MKKADLTPDDDLRPEYKRSDFGRMVRGKYAAQVLRETNVVVLEPDVAAAFTDDKAVNEALRSYMATR